MYQRSTELLQREVPILLSRGSSQSLSGKYSELDVSDEPFLMLAYLSHVCPWSALPSPLPPLCSHFSLCNPIAPQTRLSCTLILQRCLSPHHATCLLWDVTRAHRKESFRDQGGRMASRSPQAPFLFQNKECRPELRGGGNMGIWDVKKQK